MPELFLLTKEGEGGNRSTACRAVDVLTSEPIMTLKRRIMRSIREEAVRSFAGDSDRMTR